MPLEHLEELTARLNREEQRERQVTAYLMDFMRSLPFPAWVKDKAFRMVYLNPAYTAQFGIEKLAYEGKTDFDLWPPEIAAQYRANDESVIASNTPHSSIERVPATVGRTVDLIITKFPLWEMGEISGIAGICVGVMPWKNKETTKTHGLNTAFTSSKH